MFDESLATGAVITGKRTGDWGGDHHDGVPIFVPTHRSPAPTGPARTGRRLFDGLLPDHIELNLVRTLEAPGVLHLRYEVLAA